MTCADCEESSVVCVECGKRVCSHHRFGTGSLSDGYACTLGCTLLHAGMMPRPRETLVQKYGVIPIVAGVVLVVWSILAAVIGK